MKKLTQIAQEYIHLKGVDSRPVMIAITKLIQTCGDKDIEDFDRKDARKFVDSYGKVKTTTIRRRLNSINAVVNWAAYELDLQKRNPFARLIIRGEGSDAQSRQPFSVPELSDLYSRSMSYGKLRLILPILGETGCRLSEVLGATKEDIQELEGHRVLKIRLNLCRTLKTAGSERTIPIMSSCAQEAIERVLSDKLDGFAVDPYFW
jgi:integrase